MKVLIGCVLCVIAIASAIETPSLGDGVYDYHRKFGIPQAQKIKERESEILSGQRVAGGSTTTTLSVPYQVKYSLLNHINRMQSVIVFFL